MTMIDAYMRYTIGTGGGGNGDTWLVAPNCSTIPIVD